MRSVAVPVFLLVTMLVQVPAIRADPTCHSTGFFGTYCADPDDPTRTLRDVQEYWLAEDDEPVVLDAYEVTLPFVDATDLGARQDDFPGWSECRRAEGEPGETKYAWYRFTAPTTGAVTLSLDNPELTMTLFGGPAGALDALRCEDVLERSGMVVKVLAGETYHLMLTSSSPVPYTLTGSYAGAATLYDHRQDARALGGKSTAWYSFTSATRQVDEASDCGDEPAQQTVWLRYTTPEAGGYVAKFEPTTAAVTTTVAVYEEGSSTALSCGTTSAPFNGLPGTTYEIQLGVGERWDGSLKATVMPRPTPQVPGLWVPAPPGILTDPPSLACLLNSPACA